MYIHRRIRLPELALPQRLNGAHRRLMAHLSRLLRLLGKLPTGIAESTNCNRSLSRSLQVASTPATVTVAPLRANNSRALFKKLVERFQSPLAVGHQRRTGLPSLLSQHPALTTLHIRCPSSQTPKRYRMSEPVTMEDPSRLPLQEDNSRRRHRRRRWLLPPGWARPMVHRPLLEQCRRTIVRSRLLRISGPFVMNGYPRLAQHTHTNSTIMGRACQCLVLWLEVSPRGRRRQSLHCLPPKQRYVNARSALHLP